MDGTPGATREGASVRGLSAKMQDNGHDGHAMKLIAHRGGAGLHVENTLAAFENAIALGADGAELDVHLSRDGHVVVHHDDTLNPAYCRLPDGRWLEAGARPAISSLDLADLQAFDIGTPQPGTAYARRFDRIRPVSDQRVPLLRDVIGLAKTRSAHFILVIEIKASMREAARRPWEALLEATLAVVDAEDFAGRTVLCSFDWGALRRAMTLRPGLPTWFTSAPLSWFGDTPPPPADIPPSPDRLAALRALHRGGDAPWFAGFDPRRFGGSHARAVKAAGGHAWFPYYRDFTTDVARELATVELDSAVWSVNLRDETALRDLARLAPGHLVVDYPDRVVRASPREPGR